MGFLLKLSILIALSSCLTIYFYPDLTSHTVSIITSQTSKLILLFEQTKSTSKCLKEGERLFTREELSKYDGASESSDGIYLGFLGIVYDVSKGAHHYRPGGSYSFFAGKDATRAFITGEFTEDGLVDDLTDVENESFGGVQTWVDLYESDYEKIGKVIGAYYDSEGCPTDKLSWVHTQIDEYNAKKSIEEDEATIFPYCNSEWNQQSNSGRVWCSTMSGGVERDWVGVPRQIFMPEKKTYRCACVKDFGSQTAPTIEYADDNVRESDDMQDNQVNPNADNNVGDLNNPRLKQYQGCDPKSFECKIKD